MNLVKEYKNQSTWRDWSPYIERLPIDNQDTIFDFGCSLGIVTNLRAKRASYVIGIENNPELLKEAKQINSDENISYLNIDLGSSHVQNLPLGDGIWASFIAAYFPNFEPILNCWKKLLNANGWIALIEMSDLFSHEPLSKFTQDAFEAYSSRQSKNKKYDYKMGGKLRGFVKNCGLSIIHEEDIFDSELAFEGPAEPGITKSWESRFDRMVKFREYVGEKNFYKVKSEFIECLSDRNHKSNTVVKYIMAKK